MMQAIIDDAKAMESEAIAAEESAQLTYESFVAETNSNIEEKVKDIANKEEQKAKAEADKVEAEVNRDEVTATIEGLEQANADLHKSCDFLLKNFDLRGTETGHLHVLRSLLLRSPAEVGPEVNAGEGL